MDYNQIVKIVTTTIIENGEKYSTVVQKLNGVGNIIAEQQSTHKFFMERFVTYKYNDEGKVIISTEIYNDDYIKRDEHTVFEYLDDGSKIGKRYDANDTLVAIEHYNLSGQKIQEDGYLGRFLFLTRFYKYDESGNQIEESIRYEETDHPKSKEHKVGITYKVIEDKYDSFGNNISHTTYTEDGKVYFESHSVYNERNQKISSTIRSSFGGNIQERMISYEYEITVVNVKEDLNKPFTENEPLKMQVEHDLRLTGTVEIEILDKAVQNDPDAMAQVAANYYSGKSGFPCDDSLAFYWSQKVTEAYPDYDFAWEMLGRCYKFGVGTEKNTSKAIEAYAKCAELGGTNVLYSLAEMYYFEAPDSEKRKCVPLLEQAHIAGNIMATALLGHLYTKGEIIQRDNAKGIQLLEEAATKGDSEGARLLAEIYLKGEIVPKDKKLAARYFAIAVDNGEDSHKALYYAGPAYFYGEGVLKSMEKARKCMEALIDDMYVPEEKIFDLLGCMCFEGVGGQVDYILGEKALRRAIKSEDATISLEAMSNLGMYLYTLPNRLPEAMQLLQSAADQGSQAAIDKLKAIETLNAPSNPAKKRHPIRGAIIGYFVGGLIGTILHLFWPGAEWISVILGVIIGILKG